MAKPNQAWLLSFADTITLLICLFLMILAMSDAKTDSVVQWTNEQLSNTKTQIQLDLGSSMGMQLPEVEVTPNGINISMSQHDAFNSGDSTPSKELAKTLKQIARSLKQSHLLTPEEDRESQDFVQEMLAKDYIWHVDIKIEGHTDNTSIQINDVNYQHFNNWGLSALRAKEVMQILQKETGWPKHLFSIAGYGSQHPLQSNDTPEGRALNRRISILIEAGFKQKPKIYTPQSL